MKFEFSCVWVITLFVPSFVCGNGLEPQRKSAINIGVAVIIMGRGRWLQVTVRGWVNANYSMHMIGMNDTDVSVLFWAHVGLNMHSVYIEI